MLEIHIYLSLNRATDLATTYMEFIHLMNFFTIVVWIRIITTLFILPFAQVNIKIVYTTAKNECNNHH